MEDKARPYHRYVFDSANRRFIGHFEEMYRQEDIEGFDSWFQEDLAEIGRRLSLTLLSQYKFDSILDVGCGKGAFTRLLKKANNYVVGIDVSPTAIQKARAKYLEIDFRVLDATDIASLGRRFDLIVMMELLSYVEGWRMSLKTAASMTDWLYVTLVLPPDPIGFVKTFDQL